MVTLVAVCLGGCGASSGSSNFAPAQYLAANSAATGDPATRANAAGEAAKITSTATPGNSAYKIGPLDLLEITVFRVPDLTKTVQVSDMGTIEYPLVGEVKAAGKTAHEIEKDLEQKLGGKYIRSPQVTVLIKEYNSQRITIEGSVKTPGIYPMKGPTSLVQAIALSGGVDATVASGDIVIFRTIDGVRSAARFDIDSVKKGDAPDPELQPNDLVIVGTSDTKLALNNVLRVLPLATSAAIFVPLM
jgi:polysaccharide biosynthesis/export protein